MYRKKKLKKFRKKTLLILIVISTIIISTILILNNVSNETTIDSNVLNLDKYNVKYLQSYSKYGESLNIQFDNSSEHDLTFLNLDTNEQINITTESFIDKGVNLINLDEGKYVVLTSENEIINIDSEFDYTYYSITRENTNFKYHISNLHDNTLIIDISQSALPDDYYDIIIDPGHGGIDGGAESIDYSVTEAQLNLEVALELEKQLVNEGFKVKLTRDGDYNPGYLDGIESYGENSRTSYAYTYNASLFLSLHHNSDGGSGFEIYSSVNTSTDFSEIISNNLKEVLSPSTNRTMGYIKDGVYKYSVEDSDDELEESFDEESDYFYIIRETGGVNTDAFRDENIYKDYLSSSQTLLFEFGYIDNYEELTILSDSQTQESEAKAIVNSILEYTEHKKK